MEKRVDHGLAQVVARLEALIGKEHVAEDYVRLRMGLAKAQAQVRESMAGQSAAAAAAQSAGGEGKLTPATVILEREALSEYLAALCRVVEEHGRLGHELRQLRATAATEAAFLESLIRRGIVANEPDYLPQVAEQLNIPPEALLFCGRLLAAPFVAESVRQLKSGAPDDALSTTSTGQCPYCGNAPALAILRREDGKRQLVCSLCSELWEFPRLKCPFCGTENQADLNVLYVAEKDPYWIESCEQCKKYIKTVDERRYPEDQEVLPFVEETATLHLDLLAEGEGYASGIPATGSSD